MKRLLVLLAVLIGIALVLTIVSVGYTHWYNPPLKVVVELPDPVSTVLPAVDACPPLCRTPAVPDRWTRQVSVTFIYSEPSSGPLFLVGVMRVNLDGSDEAIPADHDWHDRFLETLRRLASTDPVEESAADPSLRMRSRTS